MAFPGGRARGREAHDAQGVVARERGHRPAGPGGGARGARARDGVPERRRDAARRFPRRAHRGRQTPRAPATVFFANGHERAGNASRAFPSASVPAESGRASVRRARPSRALRASREWREPGSRHASLRAGNHDDSLLSFPSFFRIISGRDRETNDLRWLLARHLDFIRDAERTKIVDPCQICRLPQSLRAPSLPRLTARTRARSLPRSPPRTRSSRIARPRARCPSTAP